MPGCTHPAGEVPPLLRMNEYHNQHITMDSLSATRRHDAIGMDTAGAMLIYTGIMRKIAVPIDIATRAMISEYCCLTRQRMIANKPQTRKKWMNADFNDECFNDANVDCGLVSKPLK